jgi:septin family protein
MSFDIQIGNGQDFAQLQHDVLQQDILKIIFTTRNYFYNEYGTQIETIIGSNNGLNATKQFLTTEITNALTLLQYLQNQQATYQIVDAAEIISQIYEVQTDYLFELTQSPQDKTSFRVTIIVINGVNQQITVSRSVSLV